LAVAEAASSKKADDIVILDVSDLLVITDFFVICSGATDRQVKAIAEEVERSLLEEHQVKPFRREGAREGHWILLDYVDLVVHVFRYEDREHYDLERLWSDAPKIVWDEAERWDLEDEPAAAEAT
jgi:ribosome-associated protein